MDKNSSDDNNSRTLQTVSNSVSRPNRGGTTIDQTQHSAGTTRPPAPSVDNTRIAEEARGAIDRAAELGHFERVPLAQLQPNPNNAKLHSDYQIGLLVESIRVFGFIGVATIDENNQIVSGHGRYEAARQLGMDALPCIRIQHLTKEAKAALALADNKLAELSDWDEEALAATLEELSSADLDFDIEVTGFDTVDLDRLLVDAAPRNETADGEAEHRTDPDDEVPELRIEMPSVSSLGRLWRMDTHYVLHGDALDPASYRRLLGGEPVNQVVTDPPYNVPNAGHVSSKAFREFAMAHGEMSPAQFTEFLARFLKNSAAHLRDGAILHVFMDWRHMRELLDAALESKLQMKNLCVWAKPSPGQGSFYRSQHELIFVLKHGASPPVNNFGLGARGRTRSNIWNYPAVRGVRSGINDPDGGHPTVKPVSMIMDAIRDCSMRGDCILDPFAGSGTTLIAAERAGRRAHLIELDGHYVDLAIRRWQAATGERAVDVDSDLSFDELERRLLERFEGAR